MEAIIPRRGENLLDLGKRCSAVYICPKDASGQRKGKLAVYAGKDGIGRNLVGDLYFNFRWIEAHPEAVCAFAQGIYNKLEAKNLFDMFDTVVGIPNGGRTLGQELARLAGKKFAYPEKKAKPKEEGKKQEYEWDLSQFKFEPGERVAVAEDVYNNFQNTDNTLTEIAASGANVVLLVGALNRSPVYHSFYQPKSGPFAGREIPIVAAVREAFPEYEQDDAMVIEDVAKGNVEWEVKKNWASLMASMEANSELKEE